MGRETKEGIAEAKKEHKLQDWLGTSHDLGSKSCCNHESTDCALRGLGILSRAVISVADLSSHADSVLEPVPAFLRPAHKSVISRRSMSSCKV
jgi:hypothetical protein